MILTRKQLIHVMTGGFLKADRVEQPEILPVDGTMTKFGDLSMQGVMETKFSA